MFQALTKTVAFEEFLNWKPDGGCYELHDGVIVEMQPVGDHEEINGFLGGEITLKFKRLKLPYLILKQALVKVPGKESSFINDRFDLLRTMKNSKNINLVRLYIINNAIRAFNNFSNLLSFKFWDNVTR